MAEHGIQFINPMRYMTPNLSEASGGTPDTQPLESIPTGMETDPHADEEVIDQNYAWGVSRTRSARGAVSQNRAG